jgi:hypothetical protein
MNSELLIETYNTIVDHPEDWDQATWTSVYLNKDTQTELWRKTTANWDGMVETNLTYLREHGCKTAMCFAGWALHLSGMDKRIIYTSDVDPEYLVSPDGDFAALPMDEIRDLCQVEGTIGEVTVSVVPIGDPTAEFTDNVENQARMALDMFGVPNLEWERLTNGENTLAELRAMVLSLVVSGTVDGYAALTESTAKITQADIDAAARSYNGV